MKCFATWRKGASQRASDRNFLRISFPRYRRNNFTRILALVGLLAASTCWAQEPASNSQQPPSQVQSQSPVAPENQTVTIPVGTRIPLALASPITTKARAGNTIRAVTGFPVTVGTQLAIPVGTYVEGVIDKVTRGGRSGPILLVHFTRILYANGYSVPVDGTNTQARTISPEPNSEVAETFEGESEPTFTNANYVVAQQQQPPPRLPPLPKVGPPIGVIVGAGLGVFAAAIITIALLAHHNGGASGVLFDTGWQFEMVLRSPLTVDAANVAASIAAQ
jgi:hypothetical protein